MAKRKAGRPPALAAKLERGNLLLTRADWRILRRAAKEEGIPLAVKVRYLLHLGMLQVGLITRMVGNPAHHPVTSLAHSSPLERPLLLTAELATAKPVEKQEPHT